MNRRLFLTDAAIFCAATGFAGCGGGREAGALPSLSEAASRSAASGSVRTPIPTSTGRTFFVSPSGDDGGDGLTAATAWRTLAKVNAYQQASPLRAGDTVALQGGATFNESLTVTGGPGGTATNPITIASYGSGRATIVAGGVALAITDIDGIVVKNVNCTCTAAAGAGGAGIYVTATAAHQNVWIDACTVTGGDGALVLDAESPSGNAGYANVCITNVVATGAFTGGILSYGTVSSSVRAMHRNVYIGNCTAFGNPGYAKPSNHSGNGIVLGNVDGGTIEYSTARGNGAQSYHRGGGPAGIWTYESNAVVIQYCEVYDQRTLGTQDGCGFDLDGGTTNCVVQYCYAHDCDGAGVLLSSYQGQSRPVGANTVRYNVLQNNARTNEAEIHVYLVAATNQIYNNTVYTRKSPANGRTATNGNLACVGAGYLGESTATVPVYRNNVLYAEDGVPFVRFGTAGSAVSFQGNAYWSSSGLFAVRWNGGSYQSLASWRASTAQETLSRAPVGIFADPRFLAPGTGSATGDAMTTTLHAYDVQAGSPLIDAALNLRTRFGIDPGATDFHRRSTPRGAGYDIGACESG